jgi:type IV pilus assembly protein PilM
MISNQAFGIEINEDRVRMADARFRDGVVYLQALGLTESTQLYFSNISSDIVIQKQAQVIHTLCTDLKITNKLVNVVVPDSVSYTQIIDMPILPEKELVSAVRYQADEFIPMNIDETYLDIEVLRTDTQANTMTILIAAAPKKIVDGVFHTIQLAGLEPHRLDTEVCSIGRLVSEIMKSRTLKEAYCILNLGFSSSSLYLIDNVTHSVEFIRSSKIGYDLIVKEVMVNLNLDITNSESLLHQPKERANEVINAILTSLKELAFEVQRSVDVYVHKKSLPVTRIFVVNYASQIYGFTALIGQLTKLHAEPLPLNTVYVPNTVLKVFSPEITEFSSVVSTTIL